MSGIAIGSVCRATVDVVHRHFAVFAVLAGAFTLIPAAAVYIAFPIAAMPRLPMPGQQPFPPLFWLAGLVAMVVYMIGWFSIGAIAADPEEGGDRSIGQIIVGVFPAIGKSILAGLLLFLAIIVIGILIGVVMAIVGVIVTLLGGGFPAPAAGGAASKTSVALITVGLVAVIVPLEFWVMARLTPMLGVLLRERVGPLDAIRRSWVLSRGSGWRIFLIILLYALVSLVVQLPFFVATMALGEPSSLAAFLLNLARLAVGAIVVVYYCAGAGIIYRQLAEQSA